MKKAKKGKLGQNALKSGAAPGGEPQAKSSPTALASGKPKWTPGPWSAYDRGIGWEVRGPLDGRINDELRDTFTDADAHLIAAAPEMYAVLDHIVQGVIDVHVVQMAREALAKARGERSAK